MSKRKYKLYLEPNSTIKLPRARLKRGHLNALLFTDDCKDQGGSHTADVEMRIPTMSPSGHLKLTQSDTDDTTDQALPYAECNREEDGASGSDSHTADVETMSPSGHLDLQLDPDDMSDQALCNTEYSREEDGASGSDSHTADVETMSPSGHLDLQLDPDDMTDQVLPLAANCRENESEVRPGSTCANHESMSSFDHLLLTSQLQPSNMAQQSNCDSSSESSFSGVDSEIPDLPEDDPFRQIGFDTDMDSVLMSAGTTTKAEALLMVMSHAARHNITGTQLDDLLKLINTLFGKEVIPRSKYLFNKVFKNNSEIVEFHFYCKTCKVYIGTRAGRYTEF
ncbi:uncharacterized protein LOC127643926 [Xyrauchen texanus]|uniref:uncharacterized protein LOC127643926 n=1 Tax=Xyrauchen texanus TaxID=154827 RepID=UPI0022419678|nr:uncharacterized protein LOC127643926 [Xyrauchen texanus]